MRAYLLNTTMNYPDQPSPDPERLAHLEALAQIVYRFVEEARAIDARYAPEYGEMAHELRALGYTVRADVPSLPPPDEPQTPE
jgi:hypothetical protein